MLKKPFSALAVIAEMEPSSMALTPFMLLLPLCGQSLAMCFSPHVQHLRSSMCKAGFGHVRGLHPSAPQFAHFLLDLSVGAVLWPRSLRACGELGALLLPLRFFQSWIAAIMPSTLLMPSNMAISSGSTSAGNLAGIGAGSSTTWLMPR